MTENAFGPDGTHAQSLAQGDLEKPCAPSQPEAALGKYSGTVSTFFDGRSGIYSETYEPARLTPFGIFWRIESHLVGGVWRHLGFAAGGRGQSPGSTNDTGGWCLFECDGLPLIYDPGKEREFAQMLLSANVGKRAVMIGPGLLVHGSADRLGVGVVHIRACRPSL